MHTRTVFSSSWELLRDTFTEWNSDNASQMGAALAFYTFFSLAPMLVIAISVAGLAFGQKAAEGRIVGEIRDLVGAQSAQTIEWMILKARQHGIGSSASMIGFCMLLVGSSGVVQALQNAFDVIWKAPPRTDLRRLVLKYVLSYAMVLGFGFLSLVSLILNTIFEALSQYLTEYLPFHRILLHAANILLSFLGITCLFAMMFKWLPQARPSWRYIWPGAVLTALMFVGGKFLLSLYLGKMAVGSIYGAAGSLAIVLLWVYYSAQILYMGVEFTKVYSRWRVGQVIEKSS